MKKVIHYNPDEAGKLHCDSCGYDLPEKLRFERSLIGHPCPKCGANMLTAKDYESTARMFRVIDRVNRWFGPIFGSEVAPARGVAVSVKIHDETTTIKRQERA